MTTTQPNTPASNETVWDVPSSLARYPRTPGGTQWICQPTTKLWDGRELWWFAQTESPWDTEIQLLPPLTDEVLNSGTLELVTDWGPIEALIVDPAAARTIPTVAQPDMEALGQIEGAEQTYYLHVSEEVNQQLAGTGISVYFIGPNQSHPEIIFHAPTIRHWHTEELIKTTDALLARRYGPASRWSASW